MKKFGFALGVAAICCLVANAGPIEPVGAVKAQPVVGTKTIMPTASHIADGKAHVKGVRPTRTMSMGHGTSGRAIEVVYDNTTTSTGYGFASEVGAEIGDDLRMTGGGVLQEMALAVWNPDAVATLTRCDIEVSFYDAGNALVGSFLIDDLDFTGGGAYAGLPPGYAQGWNITELASEDITVPPINKVVQVYSDVVTSGGPIPELGVILYDPPDIGESFDRFWLSSSVDPPDWYWFSGSPVANLYYSVTVDKTIAPPALIYSNTETETGYGFADSGAIPPINGWWCGDDLNVEQGGTLEGLEFSIVHFADSAGNDDPLMTVDAEIAFCDANDPDIVFGGPITLSLSLEPDGLPINYGAFFTVAGLSTEGIVINRSQFVVKMRFLNKDPATAGALGQLMYDPPTIGTSEDRFWLDTTVATPPGTEKGWYWFSGNPVANFYWSVTVLEAGPITFPVSVLPDLGVPASFEVDPADDSDPPQGGYGKPLTTPAYLLYNPPADLSFRNPKLTVGGQARTFLGWFFRGADPYLDTGTGAPAYETTFPVPSDAYSSLEVVFNTVLDVAAKKVDGTPVTGLSVRFTDRKTVEPGYDGDPIKDITGAGDGTTPLTRKWNPVDVAAPQYDYLQWVCVYTPASLTDGTPFLKYELTAADGTVSDFFNPDFPGRVCIRVDAFVKAVAVYGEQSAYELGDANCDGKIDAFDIDPFVLALVNLPAWQAQYCDGNIFTVDITGDGKVDAFDIDPFVAILISP